MTHMYFSARAEGIRTFRHALRAAYRTAISAAQILVVNVFAYCILPRLRKKVGHFFHDNFGISGPILIFSPSSERIFGGSLN